MFLTSLMSMRRTERRSFCPDFMADFMSSWRRANKLIVAPARTFDRCCKKRRGLLLRAGRVSYRVSRRTSRLTLEGGATGQATCVEWDLFPRDANVKPPKQFEECIGSGPLKRTLR